MYMPNERMCAKRTETHTNILLPGSKLRHAVSWLVGTLSGRPSAFRYLFAPDLLPRCITWPPYSPNDLPSFFQGSRMLSLERDRFSVKALWLQHRRQRPGLATRTDFSDSLTRRLRFREGYGQLWEEQKRELAAGIWPWEMRLGPRRRGARFLRSVCDQRRAFWVGAWCQKGNPTGIKTPL